ncbi:hypothetical protein [Vreelandella hamiltonii]|uniref:Uncharacterized protein n=1 Tax=Vreelandella hamiltonii TaxID=502829 RepID=A0A8H9I835_9GAMM|nr:hypothetical protein [Halomonas hamiltonii]GGW40697.1 hypothetical protein GCM10007157_34220 [Halomonas hamiltonii]
MEIRIKVVRNSDDSVVVDWQFEYLKEGDLEDNIAKAASEARRIVKEPFGFSFEVRKV